MGYQAVVTGGGGVGGSMVGEVDAEVAMAKRRATWKVDRSGSKAGLRKRAETLLAAAVAAHQRGDLVVAETGYDHVLSISAENAEALRLLGTLYAQTGRPAEAIPLLERAVAADPRNDDGHNNLALALEAVGRPAEAEVHLRKAVCLAPADAERHANLGALLRDAGRPEAAAAVLEAAVRRFPDHPGVLTNLGLALEALHQDEAAVAALTRAATRAPASPRVRRNLGLLLAKLGRPAAARPHLEAALAQGMVEPEVLLHLGAIHYRHASKREAEALFRRALEVAPDSALAHSNLAGLLADRRDFSAAMDHLATALRLDPECAYAHSILSSCHMARGDHAAAVDHYRRALALAPDDLALHGDLLASLVYAEEVSPEEILAVHRAWGEAVRAVVPPVARPPWDGAVGRPLRVGYVSADLRRHSVAAFLEPILAAHHPEAVEVTCYSNVAEPDAVTERLRGLVPRWRDIAALDDEAAAAQVVEDGIDVLVDLSGHTARHRLSLFARRPAPVQAAYLGYATTTGLEAMDFRITDPWLDPPPFESHYTEQLWRLPEGHLCYRPPDCSPEGEVATSPPRTTTFGSFNDMIKVGRGVVRLWAGLLRAVEGSRLLLKNGSLRDPETCRLVCDRFAEAGVAEERLELVGWSDSQEAHLALYRRVDIGLDTYPYSGATTTCEALWMGVPVITLIGDRAASRYSATLLHQVGLDALVADDPDAFVAIAADLATDRDRLATLRATLRQRMEGSLLCQPTPFTRELERAYRGMAERLWDEGRR